MSSIIVAGDVSGSVTLQAPSAAGTTTLTLPSTSGTVVTTSGGVVPTAQLASGTADSTTYLRGDQTWATVSSSPTTAQVLSATAGASVDDVGTYAFLGSTAGVTGYSQGSNYAGSGLYWAGILTSNQNVTYVTNATINADGIRSSPSGTWKCMGGNGFVQESGSRGRATLFLRVA